MQVKFLLVGLLAHFAIGAPLNPETRQEKVQSYKNPDYLRSVPQEDTLEARQEKVQSYKNKDYLRSDSAPVEVRQEKIQSYKNPDYLRSVDAEE